MESLRSAESKVRGVSSGCGLSSSSSTSDDSFMEHCTLVTLLLIRRSIPFLKATPTNKESESDKKTSTEVNATNKEGGVVKGGDSSSIPAAVLAHLCSLMDSPDTEPFVRTLAQDIIKAGVVVFFPGSRARRGYLLEMVELVLTGEQPASWWLKFEALCGYFSKTNTNSLLELSCDSEKVRKRERQRQRQKERDRQRQKERDRERQRQGDREGRERGRKILYVHVHYYNK